MSAIKVVDAAAGRVRWLGSGSLEIGLRAVVAYEQEGPLGETRDRIGQAVTEVEGSPMTPTTEPRPRGESGLPVLVWVGSERWRSVSPRAASCCASWPASRSTGSRSSVPPSGSEPRSPPTSGRCRARAAVGPDDVCRHERYGRCNALRGARGPKHQAARWLGRDARGQARHRLERRRADVRPSHRSRGQCRP